MQKYKVAGYIRLSKEDKIKDESNSVTNQKLIITSYIENNEDLELFDFYIDDGYSGTTFNRPGYKRMLKDIVEGKVNKIIVKDLSRFGRNHIESDNYLENILPGYNVRFISINDDIDTLNNSNSVSSIVIPLKNLMNDQYARDISEKVRLTLKMKQLNGEFIDVTAPYGYLKDPKDKHKFIVDKEASYNVKKIFNMVLDGKSRRQVTDFLNDNDILTPSEYLNIDKNKDVSVMKKWNPEMVNSILRNENYTGTLFQGKKRKLNYRVDKKISIDKKDQIVTENHHEAIVSKEKFDKVQYILDRQAKANKDGSIDILSGFLKCKCCCGNMIKRTSKERVYYYCSNYYRNKTCENNESISENKLIEIINEKLNLSNITRLELENKVKCIYIDKNKNIKIDIK